MSTKNRKVSAKTLKNMSAALGISPVEDETVQQNSKRRKTGVEEEEEVTEIPPTPQPVRAPPTPEQTDSFIILKLFTKAVVYLAFPTNDAGIEFIQRRKRIVAFMNRIELSPETCERLAREKDEDAIAVSGALAGLSVLSEHEFFCVGDTYLTDLRQEVFADNADALEKRTAMRQHYSNHKMHGVARRCYLCRFIEYANRLNPTSITGSVSARR